MNGSYLRLRRTFRLPTLLPVILISFFLCFSFPTHIEQSVNWHFQRRSNPVLAHHAKALSALSAYIATRFHLPLKTAETITRQAYLAAHTNKVEATLVLAIVAVESSYQPHAVNTVSGARGLMQVLPRWHRREVERIGGTAALFHIKPNIDVGTAILAKYLKWERGRLAPALGRYWGSMHCKVYVYRVKRQLRHLNRVLKSVRRTDSLFTQRESST